MGTQQPIQPYQIRVFYNIAANDSSLLLGFEPNYWVEL
jgi:hypothetical protein